MLELPKITDRQGNLTFVEGGRHLPFEVRRVFWVYDVPSGADRGAHAHKELHEVLVCISGSVDVHVDDGFRKQVITLNRPWRGLHIPPMIWASEDNFAPGTVYCVLASAAYAADDYIRDYDDFVGRALRAGRD
jgi:hypothetical protein